MGLGGSSLATRVQLVMNGAALAQHQESDAFVSEIAQTWRRWVTIERKARKAQLLRARWLRKAYITP